MTQKNLKEEKMLKNYLATWNLPDSTIEPCLSRS